jgi:glycosyltransferase involved in cell wall biosynthesis
MNLSENNRQLMQELGICVIIPTYDNDSTIIQVIERVLLFARHVIVIDDGSTDQTPQLMEKAQLPVTLIRYEKNKGKGYALKTGFLKALDLGFTYAVTIDSDGQHYPEDIPLFVEAAMRYPHAIIVGSRNLKSENMPGKNTFANKFSNFWFYLQTGKSLDDTQSGFRLYPLKRLKGLHCITNRYEAELELLVLSAWNAVELHSVPIQVYYSPEDRISHFRPVTDFLRISLLNTVLCIGTIIYALPLRIARYCRRSCV